MMRRVQTLDLVPNDILKNIDTNRDGKIDGYQFDLKNPFYTAEPIGAIKELFITVDGKKVDPKKVTLTVRGQKIRLLNASTIYEVPWASYEVISVFIEQADGLKAGNHELECTLHLTSTTTYGGELKDTEGTPYREYFTKVTMILT